jgi:hypothetical protein
MKKRNTGSNLLLKLKNFLVDATGDTGGEGTSGTVGAGGGFINSGLNNYT